MAQSQRNLQSIVGINKAIKFCRNCKVYSNQINFKFKLKVTMKFISINYLFFKNIFSESDGSSTFLKIRNDSIFFLCIVHFTLQFSRHIKRDFITYLRSVLYETAK